MDIHSCSRKRKRGVERDDQPRKHRKLCEASAAKHPLLDKLYAHLVPLPSFLLQHPALRSDKRRRQLETLLVQHAGLEEYLVGSCGATEKHNSTLRMNELVRFTQARRQEDEHDLTAKSCSLLELLEFVIWTLFERCEASLAGPSNILCHGLHRSLARQPKRDTTRTDFTTGIVQDWTGTNVDHFKKSPWLELYGQLGEKSACVLLDLLLEHSLFLKMKTGKNNYQQLSGVPVHEVKVVTAASLRDTHMTTKPPNFSRQLGNVKLARHRMLYATPDVRKSGQVQFGLGHSHALNRYSALGRHEHDVVLLKYIFPKQFKLHNVFDHQHQSGIKKQATKDYTYRETEIRLSSTRSLPRRLRGPIMKLVQRIRRNHSKTQYAQLLAHYCRIPISTDAVGIAYAHDTVSRSIFCSQTRQEGVVHDEGTQLSTRLENESTDTSLLPYATPASSVGAFCMASIRQILPRDALGSGPDGVTNRHIVLRNVYKFVIARKAESTTMHELVQGLKVKSVPWLTNPQAKPDQNLSLSDERKRQEIMYEFVHYLFDSLLIPLIATNFYLTESGIHKNKLLYFRHDVWQRLSRPHIDILTSTTLSPVPKSDLSTATSSSLGLGSVRLVPKDKGCRPITNLQQTSIKSVNGRQVVHASINAKLQPLFNIFNYERGQEHDVFRVHSFSWQDIHRKLIAFRARTNPGGQNKLYFVKTDIQSAFQSIPQQRLLEIVSKIFRHERYSNNTRVDGKLRTGLGDSVPQPQYVYRRLAKPAQSASRVADVESLIVPSAHDHVYVELERRYDTSAQEALETLHSHVCNSLVKVNGRVYRQVEGIPQGSKISSLLCTFFYNHFEKHKLQFLNETQSIVLRVVDDFLLITTNQTQADEFLQALKDGDQEYGITIHLDKCLVNFDTIFHDQQIPKLSITRDFPFCGLLIDTQTLQVSKDRVAKGSSISNTLSVESNGRAAVIFSRRTIGALKNQFLPILLDRELNDVEQVIRSLVECLQVATMKMHQHFVILPHEKRPSPTIVIDVVKSMIALAERVVNRHSRCPQNHWSRGRVGYIASMAIASVLWRKNTHYERVLTWLQAVQTTSQHFAQARVVVRIVQNGLQALDHLEY